MNRLNHTLCAIIFFGLFSAPMTAQYYNKKVAAEIKIKTRDHFLDVTGTATNKTSVNKSLRYELSVIKNNSGNYSKSAQNGRFTLKPNEFKKLSKTSINLDTKNRIIVLLLVYDLDDHLLGKDRYVINDSAKNEKAQDVKEYTNKGGKQSVAEDGVVLRGIVTQNTKTKAGNDFYNYFSSAYRLSNLNSEKIITIDEKFNFGRSTQIEVKVDRKLVFKFFVRPKEDYLKSMVKATLLRVTKYLQQQQQNTEQIKKY